MLPRCLVAPWLAPAALLAAMLGACIGREATRAIPLGRPSLGPRGDEAYEVLLHARRITDGAIGYAGTTPIEVVALRHFLPLEQGAG